MSRLTASLSRPHVQAGCTSGLAARLGWPRVWGEAALSRSRAWRQLLRRAALAQEEFLPRKNRFEAPHGPEAYRPEAYRPRACGPEASRIRKAASRFRRGCRFRGDAASEGVSLHGALKAKWRFREYYLKAHCFKAHCFKAHCFEVLPSTVLFSNCRRLVLPGGRDPGLRRPAGDWFQSQLQRRNLVPKQKASFGGGPRFKRASRQEGLT